MKETKTNFIEEMKRKLNEYQIQKIHRKQEYHKNKDYFKQEIQVKDALMKYDESFNEIEQFNKYQDISGWSSNRPSLLDQNQYQINSQRKSYSLRKNIICSAPSKQLSYKYYEEEYDNHKKQKNNHDMIKLQSPPLNSKKRNLKTQCIKGNEENSAKIKLLQGIQNMNNKRPRTILQTNRNIQKLIEQQIKLQKQKQLLKTAEKQKEKERPKFHTIDLNAQNSNPSYQSAIKPNSQYQKIRRKISNTNQDQIDIVYEKNILQQLIRGTSASKNNMYMQKNNINKGNDKFTLKNLLY